MFIRCSHCKEDKNSNEFRKNVGTKNGFHNQCKDCEKEYRDKNKSKIREYQWKWKIKNKLGIKPAIRDKWKDVKFKNEYTKNKHREKRGLAISALGGTCVKCGMTDIRCLQIDHINGGGVRDARETPAYTRYNRICDNPEEAKKKYQILCANCNWIKREENDEVNMGRRKRILLEND